MECCHSWSSKKNNSFWVSLPQIHQSHFSTEVTSISPFKFLINRWDREHAKLLSRSPFKVCSLCLPLTALISAPNYRVHSRARLLHYLHCAEKKQDLLSLCYFLSFSHDGSAVAEAALTACRRSPVSLLWGNQARQKQERKQILTCQMKSKQHYLMYIQFTFCRSFNSVGFSKQQERL